MSTRPGTRLVYQAQPGERLLLLASGFTVVAHPDRPVKLVHPDGTLEAVSL